jgi:hypothetical protein
MNVLANVLVIAVSVFGKIRIKSKKRYDFLGCLFDAIRLSLKAKY